MVKVPVLICCSNGDSSAQFNVLLEYGCSWEVLSQSIRVYFPSCPTSRFAFTLKTSDGEVLRDNITTANSFWKIYSKIYKVESNCIFDLVDDNTTNLRVFLNRDTTRSVVVFIRDSTTWDQLTQSIESQFSSVAPNSVDCLSLINTHDVDIVPNITSMPEFWMAYTRYLEGDKNGYFSAHAVLCIDVPMLCRLSDGRIMVQLSREFNWTQVKQSIARAYQRDVTSYIDGLYLCDEDGDHIGGLLNTTTSMWKKYDACFDSADGMYYEVCLSENYVEPVALSTDKMHDCQEKNEANLLLDINDDVASPLSMHSEHSELHEPIEQAAGYSFDDLSFDDDDEVMREIDSIASQELAQEYCDADMSDPELCAIDDFMSSASEDENLADLCFYYHLSSDKLGQEYYLCVSRNSDWNEISACIALSVGESIVNRISSLAIIDNNNSQLSPIFPCSDCDGMWQWIDEHSDGDQLPRRILFHVTESPSPELGKPSEIPVRDCFNFILESNTFISVDLLVEDCNCAWDSLRKIIAKSFRLPFAAIDVMVAVNDRGDVVAPITDDVTWNAFLLAPTSVSQIVVSCDNDKMDDMQLLTYCSFDKDYTKIAVNFKRYSNWNDICIAIANAYCSNSPSWIHHLVLVDSMKCALSGNLKNAHSFWRVFSSIAEDTDVFLEIHGDDFLLIPPSKLSLVVSINIRYKGEIMPVHILSMCSWSDVKSAVTNDFGIPKNARLKSVMFYDSNDVPISPTVTTDKIFWKLYNLHRSKNIVVCPDFDDAFTTDNEIETEGSALVDVRCIQGIDVQSMKTIVLNAGSNWNDLRVIIAKAYDVNTEYVNGCTVVDSEFDSLTELCNCATSCVQLWKVLALYGVSNCYLSVVIDRHMKEAPEDESISRNNACTKKFALSGDSIDGTIILAMHCTMEEMISSIVAELKITSTSSLHLSLYDNDGDELIGNIDDMTLFWRMSLMYDEEELIIRVRVLQRLEETQQNPTNVSVLYLSPHPSMGVSDALIRLPVGSDWNELQNMIYGSSCMTPTPISCAYFEDSNGDVMSPKFKPATMQAFWKFVSQRLASNAWKLAIHLARDGQSPDIASDLRIDECEEIEAASTTSNTYDAHIFVLEDPKMCCDVSFSKDSAWHNFNATVQAALSPFSSVACFLSTYEIQDSDGDIVISSLKENNFEILAKVLHLHDAIRIGVNLLSSVNIEATIANCDRPSNYVDICMGDDFSQLSCRVAESLGIDSNSIEFFTVQNAVMEDVTPHFDISSSMTLFNSLISMKENISTLKLVVHLSEGEIVQPMIWDHTSVTSSTICELPQNVVEIWVSCDHVRSKLSATCSETIWYDIKRELNIESDELIDSIYCRNECTTDISDNLRTQQSLAEFYEDAIKTNRYLEFAVALITGACNLHGNDTVEVKPDVITNTCSSSRVAAHDICDVTFCMHNSMYQSVQCCREASWDELCRNILSAFDMDASEWTIDYLILIDDEGDEISGRIQVIDKFWKVYFNKVISSEYFFNVILSSTRACCVNTASVTTLLQTPPVSEVQCEPEKAASTVVSPLQHIPRSFMEELRSTSGLAHFQAALTQTLGDSCSRGDLGSVKEMLQLNAEPNDSNSDGDNALHKACARGDLDIVRVLIAHGAHCNAVNKIGATPLHIALMKDGCFELCAELIQNGAVVTIACEGGSALDLIIRRKDEALLKLLLLRKDFDINVGLDKGLTLLHVCVLHNYSECVRILLRRNVFMNIHDENGDTPLHIACSSGNINMALDLVRHGALLSAVNNAGCTPMMIACKCGEKDLFQHLILHNNLDLTDVDGDRNTYLHAACANGCIDIVKILVARGVSKTVENRFGLSAPHVAASCGHLPLLVYMIDTLQIDINISTSNGMNLLHSACTKADNRLVLEWLIDHGIDLHHADTGGRTPFLVCAQYGHLSNMQYLLSRRADIHVVTATGENALHLAANMGRSEVVEWLCSKGVDLNARNNTSLTPVELAWNAGYFQLASELQLNQDIVASSSLADVMTTLESAIESDNFARARKILADMVNHQISDFPFGSNALHFAAACNHIELAQYLIMNGYDVNAVTNVGRTPMHYAAYKRHLEMMEYLYSVGGDPDIIDHTGASVATIAAQFDFDDITNWLGNVMVEKDSCDVDFPEPVSGPSLLFSCASIQHPKRFRPYNSYRLQKEPSTHDVGIVHGDNEIRLLHAARDDDFNGVKKCVQFGAMVNYADEDSLQTPLHMACLCGNLDIVRYLVDFGANVNALTCDGLSPLFYAVENQYEDVAAYLLRRNASACGVDDDENNIVHLVCRDGMTDLLSQMVLQGVIAAMNVDAVNRFGKTALHVACSSGLYNEVSLLISCDCQVNVTDVYGRTPLHYACVHESGEKVVVFIATHGGDVNMRDRWGYTPFLLACLVGNVNIAHWLARNNALVDDKTNKQSNAIHVACAAGHINIVKWLCQLDSIDANDINQYSLTPLDYAHHNNHSDIASWLSTHCGSRKCPGQPNPEYKINTNDILNSRGAANL